MCSSNQGSPKLQNSLGPCGLMNSEVYSKMSCDLEKLMLQYHFQSKGCSMLVAHFGVILSVTDHYSILDNFIYCHTQTHTA